MGKQVDEKPTFDLCLLMKCCGPAGASPARDGALRIKGEVFLVVGQHCGAHQTWSCVENVLTGKRWDYCDLRLEAALSCGEIVGVPAMELIALMATHAEA